MGKFFSRKKEGGEGPSGVWPKTKLVTVFFSALFPNKGVGVFVWVCGGLSVSISFCYQADKRGFGQKPLTCNFQLSKRLRKHKRLKHKRLRKHKHS